MDYTKPFRFEDLIKSDLSSMEEKESAYNSMDSERNKLKDLWRKRKISDNDFLYADKKLDRLQQKLFNSNLPKDYTTARYKVNEMDVVLDRRDNEFKKSVKKEVKNHGKKEKLFKSGKR